MKLLWLSDSPLVPSGFGNVTRFVCDGLARLGHEIHILGWQASGVSQPWNGAMLHSVGWHPMGADVLLSYLCRLRPDFLITLADVWWLAFLTHPSIEQFFRMTATRWVMYFPIDGHRPDGTLPPSWVEMLRRADVPVAMSHYGQAVTQTCGVRCAYIPHGVETALFRPADDATAAKRRLGYQGRFVILSDARNQPRKMLPRLLTLFAQFAADKSDVVLHLHCDPDDPASMEDRYSYRVDADVRALGLEDQVHFTHGFSMKSGLALDDLVQVYQAADVHLLVSTGEGFGLPTLQAASCGVVPMAPAYTANCELIKGHGATIKVAQFVPDEFGIGRGYVDINDAVAQLEGLYRDRALLHHWGRNARAFAEPYDWACIIPLWDELLRRHAGARVSQSRLSLPQREEVLSIGRQGFDTLDPRTPIVAGPTLATPHGEDLATSSVVQTLRNGFATIPGGVNITLKVSAHRAGEVARQVLADSRLDSGSPRLHFPIARTEYDDGGQRPRERASGLIYLSESSGDGTIESASQNLFLALRALFPVLRTWPRGRPPEPIGQGRVTRLDPWDPTRHAADAQDRWFMMLARSILALDLEGESQELPVWTAYLGVPTFGLGDNRWQRLFWPELCLDAPDDPTVLRRARRVLTDYVATATLAQQAAAAFDRYAPPAIAEETRHLEARVKHRRDVAVQLATPVL